MFDQLEPQRLGRLAPRLTVTGRPPELAQGAIESQPGGVQRIEELALKLASRGWGEAPVVTASLASDLDVALERLSEASLPLTALYVFDQVWDVGEAVRSLASRALGIEYTLVADAWAFRVLPGERGWPAHRGVYQPLDRSRPEYLNVWVALSDVEVDRACMAFVPLDSDPAYVQGALDQNVVPDGAAVSAPVARGTALFWNANTLHWGGACAASARGPRTSITFTLFRAEGARLEAPALVDPAKLDPWRRLELVAQQILVYAGHDSSLSDRAREWAKMTVEMARRLRR